MLALFDRLDQRELPDVKQSVLDELRRILSARVYTEDIRQERTILNYGIPNIVETDQDNLAHQEKMARQIRSAIEAYEPRLKTIRIEWVGSPPDTPHLYVVISGQLAAGEEDEPLRLILDYSEIKGN